MLDNEKIIFIAESWRHQGRNRKYNSGGSKTSWKFFPLNT